MVKTGLKRLIDWAGLGYDSLPFEFYRRIRVPQYIKLRDQEIKFYGKLLNGLKPNDLIFDIGANNGSKTYIFLSLGAKVLSVDPDCEFLQQRFKRNRKVQVLCKGVSCRTGEITFYTHTKGSAYNTFSDRWRDALNENRGFEFEKKTVEICTLDQLIEKFGLPFYIKIDVEGHELEVIQGLSKTVPFLSFEINLPYFLDEGIGCAKLLEQMKFNYSVDVTKGLALSTWLNADDFIKFLVKTDLLYMEVFCASGESALDC